MKRILRILLFVILIICGFMQFKLIDYFTIDLNSIHEKSNTMELDQNLTRIDRSHENDYFISDTIYRWDEHNLTWVTTDEIQETIATLTNNSSNHDLSLAPVELEWKVLMDIQYKLRYFKDLDMEIYAPVFSKTAESLHGKEVIIEGFVIPFDEEGDVLSLSFNPYASCFFCGKASPASIISMYLKNKRKHYKIDDFKKFRGTLFLNYDDPEEFYYILKDAKEE